MYTMFLDKMWCSSADTMALRFNINKKKRRNGNK